MPFQGTRAQHETSGNLLVVQALGHERQHDTLTTGQRRHPVILGLALAEGVELSHECLPGGVVSAEDVVAARERHESSTRDERGQVSPFLERGGGVISQVDHQGGHPQPSGLLLDVDLVGRLPELRGHVRRGRQALELVEGSTTSGGASGMNRLENTRRYPGFSFPHPTLVSSTRSRCSSCAAADPPRRARPRA